jgi:hypothetical protein
MILPQPPEYLGSGTAVGAEIKAGPVGFVVSVGSETSHLSHLVSGHKNRYIQPSRSSTDMKRLRVAIILVVVAIPFVFLVPIVPSSVNQCPPGFFCPPEAFINASHVSISYYVVGVGGRLLGTTYQILFWPGWFCNYHSNGYECHQIIWSAS